MVTHPLPIAGKLPIKTLVARQLPTNTYMTGLHTCHITTLTNLKLAFTDFFFSLAVLACTVDGEIFAVKKFSVDDLFR